MACYWFIFTTVSGADPLDPLNYCCPTNTKPLCPGTCRVCAIFACDDGFGYPVITQELIDEMVRALQWCLDQTLVVLRT